MIDETLARLAVSLSMDASQFAAGSTSVQKEMQRLAGAVQGLGDKWTQAGKRLTLGVSTPLAAFGLLSAKTASDAQELESAFGQTFGDLSDTMTDWAQATGDAMGRSTQSMQEMANTFGIFFNQAAPTRQIAADMSKTFTVLAQDLSSFFNVSEDDALAKLRSGLSGESEPLRDFGVFLDEATVKAKGLEMGLGGLSGELTEQEKIMARAQLILEKTTDAQGDVLRTSDGAANQARAFTGALEELQVVIGKKLLPMLTPLIEGATKVLNAFTNLPSPVQNIIIGIGALAAAMGPLMLVTGTLAVTLLPLFAAKFGPIGLAISAFLNPLGTAISLLAQFAINIGGLTILKTIGGLLLRFAGPVGLIASAGLLIYKNWDGISSVFQEFFKNAEAALGPPMQELISAVQALFSALWEGPLGDGIKSAMALASEFGEVLGEVFGGALIGTLTFFLDSLTWVLTAVGDATRVIAALLRGDWSGAWNAAATLVSNLIQPFANFGSQVVAIMQKMYQGVKTWLMDKLAPIFNWVGDKTRMVSGFFRDMYIAVVGNSFVPDMVDGIAAEMARLDAVMVDPARKAAKSTADAMRDMQREVSGLLARLFPEIEAARQQASELETLRSGQNAGMISSQTRFAGIARVLGDATVSGNVTGDDPLVDFKVMAESIPTLMGKVANDTKIKTVQIAQSFADMAQNSIRAIEGLTSAIKGGGFLDILGSAVNLFLQLGSTGLFGKGLAANINMPRIPGNAQGTNNWRGGLTWVGERGPELAHIPRGGQVISNRDLKAANSNRAGGHITVGIDPANGNITAFVNGQIAATAPAIAGAGAAMAQGQMAARARRRVR